MTRKDYQIIAGVLIGAKSYMEWVDWSRLVEATAHALYNDNARFDYQKFYSYCGAN